MPKTRKMIAFLIILVMMIAIMPLNIVNAEETDTNDSDSQIIRKTTTIYHTKVQGTLNITGDNTYTKNYSSGDDYLDGNYSDAEIATIINNYKNDMNTVASNYNATVTFDEDVSEYYYEAHDEITQEGNNGSDVILVGDINDLDQVYANQGQITINTILDKYQIYTINGTATSTSVTTTPITSANITLTAPKVGDKVEKITKNDGYGDYEAQSVQPIVSTTTEGLTVNAFWVKGLEELSQESFYGTFEEDTYYYALIDFEAQNGYEFPSTFPDGIKVNGKAPDEVFAVMGGKWNHCIAKIKTTTAEETTPTYEFIDNTANQTYTISQDDALTFRINADYSLFENGGKVYVDETGTTEYTSKSGSTIITLNKDFVNSLSVGEHTLKVAFNNNGTATTKFTIAKAAEEETTTEVTTTEEAKTETPSKNPRTGDNIILMVGLFIIATLGTFIIIKHNKNSK